MWIQIIIHINNKSEKYQVRYDEKIENIKKRICKDFDVDDDNLFYLATNTKYLQVDNTVKESGLKQNSNMYVIYKLGFGGYLFLNIKGKIERINVSLDHSGKEIITKISEIKKFVKQLINDEFNLVVYRDQKELVLNNLEMTLNDIGIKNAEKPLEENMIFIQN
ncbi:hypothetical protein CPAV1605_1298 [seawater metagenome]|uniref:Ubiquitin-like domain-containing protein n=1 Tax=seawater metagenome TaxID=1561972 RepID=A0A5E8CK34_9ZZZZ